MDFFWRSMSLSIIQVPEDALAIGSYGGEKAFVGRIIYEGITTFAIVIPVHKSIFNLIQTSSGKTLSGFHFVPNTDLYDILCTTPDARFAWQRVPYGSRARGALSIGQDRVGEKTYIGRSMVSGVWLPGLLTSAHCFQIFIGNCNDMQHDHFEILVNDATPDNAPNVVIDLSDETDESNETDGNDENNVTDESVETDGNDQTHPTYHYPDRMTHPTPQIPSGLLFGAFNSSAMTEASPRAMDATNRVLQETKLLNIQLIFPSLHSMCDDDNANTTQDTPQVFPSLNLSAEVADGVEPANRCLLCHIKERDSVLGQCGHSNYCFECAQRLWKAPGGGTCPICTTLIENVIQLRL